MNLNRENYNITFKNTFNNDKNSNKNYKKINNSFDNSISSSKYFFDNINYNFNDSKKYIDFSLKNGAKLNDKNLMKFVNKKKNIINKVPIITEQISKNKFLFYNYNKSKKNIKINNNLNIEDKKRKNNINFKKNNFKNNTNISSKKSSIENSSYDSKNINFNNYNINKNLFEIKLFPYNNNNINNNNIKNNYLHTKHLKQKNLFDNSSHNAISFTIEYNNTNNNYNNNNNIENKIISQDNSFIQISNFLNNFIDIKFHINFLCMPRVVNLLNINIRIIFMMTKSLFYLKYNIENFDIKWLNSNNRSIINSFNIINVVFCDFKEKIIDKIKVINIVINENNENNNNFDILCNNNNEAKLFVNSINIVCNYCKCKCYKYKEKLLS